MSVSPFFSRDLFGSEAGLSGWPSDGLDDPPLSPGTVADLRASPARAMRVVLGLAALHRQPDLLAPAAGSIPVAGAETGD